MSLASNPFQQSAMADLYSILAGADLMVQANAGYTQEIAADVLEDLLKWERDGLLNVHDFDQKRIRRLGFYAEALMLFFLTHHPRFELLAANHQVIVHGQTLGELDYVFEDKKLGELIHLELACKFYLKLPDVHGLAGFVGLNRRDTLARKWEKMTNIQLNPPLEWFEGIPGLHGKTPKSMACFKGRLFYPDETELHPTINPLHEKGIWVTDKNQISEPINYCHKLAWLSGVKPDRTDFPKVEYNADMYCSEDQLSWWIVQ